MTSIVIVSVDALFISPYPSDMYSARFGLSYDVDIWLLLHGYSDLATAKLLKKMDVGPPAAEEKYIVHPPPHLMAENPIRFGFDFQLLLSYQKTPETRQCLLFLTPKITKAFAIPSTLFHRGSMRTGMWLLTAIYDGIAATLASNLYAGHLRGAGGREF